MNRFFRIVLFASAVLIGGSASASASTMGNWIGGPDCGSCQGATYTLEILGFAPVELNADGNQDTYRVLLTIDTSGYTGGGAYIDEVGVKIASSADDAKIISAPEGASNWSIVSGGLNGNGCSGGGGGWDCGYWIGSGRTYVIPGDKLQWEFYIDVNSALLSFDSINGPSIKVRYVDEAGDLAGRLVSETVPEPSTLALLGIGASIAAVRRRRAQR